MHSSIGFTIGLVCIGQEVTDELDYTPAKLHINRTIRPKYITKEDEPLFAVHRLYVFSEIYQQIDESPIKVQDRDKPGTLHQGYMSSDTH